jgi:serine-type D-Ala-D-Ala carboxypeptidase (penicillin-binding protein 5/6)
MNLIKFSSYSIKAFIASFIAVFAMVALSHLGVSTAKIISPLPPKTDILEKIMPKLEQKENNFSLKKTTFLISTAQASDEYDEAEAYAVVDFHTGEIILSKNSEERNYIASVTKIMTAVVALDLAEQDEYFVVSEKAANQIPTKLALNPGDKLTLEELLNALLLTSANDCAKVIQEGIDQKYGEAVFVRAMNAKAETLGLKNSSFQNPAGFDGSEHFSTAEDVAVLSHYALANYPLISQIVSKDHSELYSNSNHPKYEWLNNWNGLIGVYPGASGIKIGNTDNAGHTTSVVAERDGKKLLVVLLGAPGVLERDLWASKLLDAGFEKWGIEPAEITEENLREKYATWKYPS